MNDEYRPWCFGAKREGLINVYNDPFNMDQCESCKIRELCDRVMRHKTNDYKTACKERALIRYRRIHKVSSHK
jgi:hypothetical protein